MAVLNKSNRLNKKRRESTLPKSRKCSILSNIRNNNMLSTVENTTKKPNSIISVLKKLEKTNPDFIKQQREIGNKAKAEFEESIIRKNGKEEGTKILKYIYSMNDELDEIIIKDLNLCI